MSRRPAVELVWPGKYGPDGERVESPPRVVTLQEELLVGPAPARDRLICGDNLLALDALLATHAGAVDLVYIDPPFSTGQAFERTAQVGDDDGPELRVHAYHDRWSGGLAGFLQMLDPRLRRLHRLLAPHGSMYVHVDPTVGHAVKLLLDEIFGPGCFQREIVWRIGWVSGFKARANNWIRNHDLIFFYVKDPQRFVFNRQVVPHPPEYRRRRGADTKQGGVPVEDVWNASPAEWNLRGAESLDSIQIKSFSREKTGWATQKNESLLRRIIAASSKPGALVVDVFCGAGTTLAAAQALGRRWIGCDSAAAAIELAQARLSEAPGASFARCGLGASERVTWAQERGEAWPAAILKLLRAEAGGGALSGIAGEVAVLVGPIDAPVPAEAVRAAARAAGDRGLRTLEVLAWEWGFPAGIDLAGETDIDVVCLQLRRALLDPRLAGRTELLWGERPAVAVAFVGERTADGVQVVAELGGVSFAHPERLPAGLPGDGRALVEAWAIAVDDAGGPLRPDLAAARTRNRRELVVRTGPVTLSGEGPWTARARVVDATGGESWHRWRLAWTDAGLASEPIG